MMRLGIGLIGAMGRGAYIGKLFNDTGDAEVRIVVDVDPAAFEVGCERFEAPGITPVRSTQLDDLLARNDLHWTVIGTPDRTHYELARQVIQSGKNVFIEKPMTSTLEQADELCALARRRNVRVVVGCELRYSPPVQAVGRALEQGLIGTPVSVVFVHQEARGYTYFLRNFRKQCWGGVLMQKGIHSIDMLNGWVDTAPQRVTASGRQAFFGGRDEADGRYCRDCDDRETCAFAFGTVPSPTWRKGGPRERGEHAFDHCVFMPDSDTQDTMHVCVEYEGGVHASYTAVYFAPVNRKEVWIWGTKGSIHAVLDGNEPYVETVPFVGQMREGTARRLPVERAAGGHGGGDGRMVRAIIDATRNGSCVRPDARDGRRGVAVARAAMQAMSTGMPQAIPPE
jgi:predicted dehydrogenase